MWFISNFIWFLTILYNLSRSVFYHYYSEVFSVSFMFLWSALKCMNGAVQIKSLSVAASVPFNFKDVINRLVLNFHSVEHFSSQAFATSGTACPRRLWPSVNYFLSYKPGLARLPHCSHTRKGGRVRWFYTSCFLFPTLFERREVTDHMWGATQVPVSAPLNVPFMSEQCSAKFLKNKKKKLSRLMWSVGKQKHDGWGRFTL